MELLYIVAVLMCVAAAWDFGRRWVDARAKQKADESRVFRLERDLGELREMVNKHHEIVRSLEGRLNAPRAVGPFATNRRG